MTLEANQILEGLNKLIALVTAERAETMTEKNTMETDETMVHGPGEKDKNKKCTYKDFKTTYPPVFNGELDQ